ncbi:MAG: zf-HC2 domain-containing protein [Pseudomonadota bacterium]
MPNKTPESEQHVGELLSGYIDGELTQQERQRVELHCERCEECRVDLAELSALRRKIGDARLGEAGEDNWGENMNDTGVRVTAAIGWILLIGGAILGAGAFVFALLFDPSIGLFEKLLIVGVYGGLAGLLIAVLRQRLIERKTDKYKNVRI